MAFSGTSSYDVIVIGLVLCRPRLLLSTYRKEPDWVDWLALRRLARPRRKIHHMIEDHLWCARQVERYWCWKRIPFVEDVPLGI